MSSVRGYDNLYNQNINDIALMNYNKGIANRLRMQEQQAAQNLPFKEPKMLGGVRASNTILSGNSIDGSTTLSVGGKAFRRFTGNETALEGGRASIDDAYKWKNFGKETANDAIDLFGKVKEKVGMGRKKGGKASIDDAYKWKNFGKETANDAIDLFGKVKEKVGRGRPKTTGGKIKMKDVVDWGKFGVETAQDAVGLANKIHSKIGGSKIDDARNWKKFALETADDALGVFDKIKSKGGMVYSQSLKDALMKGRSEKPKSIIGGARKTRFVKGSAEAKAWGEKMRQARMKK
jgi:hypothetical protein